MQINMTTFASRKQHYVDGTMQSLFASDWQGSEIPVNVMLGSEDDSHVRPYADHPLVRLVPWDTETDPSLRSNCTLNKIRALRHGDDEDTLVVEDDIEFRPDWLASLRAAAGELEGDYVLSLFSALPFLEKREILEGTTWIKDYPMEELQGAQGLYYPNRNLRERVAEYLTEHIGSACGDELIGCFARAETALYATRELLVVHVGQVSCFHSRG